MAFNIEVAALHLAECAKPTLKAHAKGYTKIGA
jgi:hypothetical protein